MLSRAERRHDDRPLAARDAERRGAAVRTDLFLLLAAFASATAVAALLGAANFGTALTFGQIAFAAALAWVLLRR
jgi:hypothetical protein